MNLTLNLVEGQKLEHLWTHSSVAMKVLLRMRVPLEERDGNFTGLSLRGIWLGLTHSALFSSTLPEMWVMRDRMIT